MSYDYDDDSGNSYFQAIGAVILVVLFTLIFPFIPWILLVVDVWNLFLVAPYGHVYPNWVIWGSVVIGGIITLYIAFRVYKGLFVSLGSYGVKKFYRVLLIYLFAVVLLNIFASILPQEAFSVQLVEKEQQLIHKVAVWAMATSQDLNTTLPR